MDVREIAKTAEEERRKAAEEDTLQDFKQMRGNYHTALASNDDAIANIIHREQNGQWYGPTIPPPPTDLPDFYKEVEHIQVKYRQQSFNNKSV